MEFAVWEFAVLESGFWNLQFGVSVIISQDRCCRAVRTPISKSLLFEESISTSLAFNGEAVSNLLEVSLDLFFKLHS